MSTVEKVSFDHAGSTFDNFLEEEGILEEVEAVAIKRVIAWQLAEAMKAGSISKKAMAERMGTSRSQLDRLLDPENSAVHLQTIAKAARAVGKRIRLEMIDAAQPGAEQGIRQGLEDAKKGKLRPARQFFAEFEAADGLSR
jgi:DNA-binding Xre family transcriptional regulator